MGRRFKILPVLCAAALIFSAMGAMQRVLAQDGTCVRGDFVAVVDEAAAALRNLNEANKTKFQGLLRDLKTKHGWSREQYLKAAKPYVRDPQIEQFDGASAKLLGEIAALGQEGSEASHPDCAVLSQLRAKMDVLVKTQNDKWVYMFAKIDKALAE